MKRKTALAPRTSPRGYLMVASSALLFGTYGIWARLMGDSFPPFYQAWVRSLIILVIMLPFMLYYGSFQKIRRADWPAFGVFIGFSIFTVAPIYYAFNHAAIGLVLLVFYSMFIFTAYAAGRFYLGEHITFIKLLAMALAVVGLVLIFHGAVAAFGPLGLALAALSGIASGGEVSSSKRVEVRYSPALIAFVGWLFIFVTNLPLSLAMGEPQLPITLSTAWLWMLVFALVSAAAFWLVLTGFKLVDASVGSLIGVSEVVFGVLFGAIIFHEVLEPSVYLGGLIIMFAAVLPDLVAIHHHRAITPRSHL